MSWSSCSSHLIRRLLPPRSLSSQTLRSASPAPRLWQPTLRGDLRRTRTHATTLCLPHSQTYRGRRFFVLAFDVRLVASFDAEGGAASYFLTSSTTSCHQCSAGPLSNPSSRRRVSANCGSWCQASQSARVLHVPTITRRSALSDCLRSCPPTQPGRFFAADKRVRIAVSHSRPAPSFRCTCVTIVIMSWSSPGTCSTRINASSTRATYPSSHVCNSGICARTSLRY